MSLDVCGRVSIDWASLVFPLTLLQIDVSMVISRYVALNYNWQEQNLAITFH